MFDRLWRAFRHFADQPPTSVRSADELSHRLKLRVMYSALHEIEDLPHGVRPRPPRLVYTELNRRGVPEWRAA